MKNMLKLAGCILSMVLLLPLSGCDPITDDGSYIAPISLYEKISGIWNLTDVRQTDERTKAAGISPNEISLYAEFQFSTMVIELKAEGNQPSSYTVSGDVPELFPKTGFWKLESEFPYADATAPTILLFSDAACTVKTGELGVASVPGAQPEMQLKLTRTSKGVPFVSYLFKLTKN
jgi:hypothetical protein